MCSTLRVVCGATPIASGWRRCRSTTKSIASSSPSTSLRSMQAERRLRASGQRRSKSAAQLPLYREHVAWLRCFRGIDTTIAMIFVAELHGVERFDSPRALAAYLGLVPSLYASGDSARRGKITKTGNGHIRRALVQASWQYRHHAGVGAKLRERQKGQPERVLTIADEAQRRPPDVIDDSPPVGRTATRSSSLSRARRLYVAALRRSRARCE